MIELETDHAYVILVGVASWMALMKLGHNVGGARKKYKVDLPAMYASGAKADTEDGRMFNCYQRAHQNMLETYPTFLFFLAVVGSQMPCYASACGAAYVVGRMMYASGYYTGDPSKRTKGILYLAGLLGLIGGAVYIAIGMLLKK